MRDLQRALEAGHTFHGICVMHIPMDHVAAIFSSLIASLFSTTSQAASNVAITGGTIDNITLDGGAF